MKQQLFVKTVQKLVSLNFFRCSNEIFSSFIDIIGLILLVDFTNLDLISELKPAYK